MPFITTGNFAAPRIGQPLSLGRGHVDPATLALTLIYYELVNQAGIWVSEERQQVLTEGTHFSLNKRNGTITLLDHAFWHTLGFWRAADREEELLYKDRVKRPQRVEYSCEFYAPEPVKVKSRLAEFGGGNRVIGVRQGQTAAQMLDLDEISSEAVARLGYSLPVYQELVAQETA